MSDTIIVIFAVFVGFGSGCAVSAFFWFRLGWKSCRRCYWERIYPGEPLPQEEE